MKKQIRILIVVCLLFVGINTCYAYTFTHDQYNFKGEYSKSSAVQVRTKDHSTESPVPRYWVCSDGKGANEYSATCAGSEKIYLFCIDPGIQSPSTQVFVKRYLYSDKSKMAEDYAVATILNLFSQNGQDDEFNYARTTLALRGFINAVVKDIKSKTGNVRNYYSTAINFAYGDNMPKEFQTEYKTACTNAINSKQYKFPDAFGLECGYKANGEDYRNKYWNELVKRYDTSIKELTYKNGTSNADVYTYLLEGIKAYNKAMAGEVSRPSVIAKDEGRLNQIEADGSTSIVAVASFAFKDFTDLSKNQSYLHITKAQMSVGDSSVSLLGYSDHYPTNSSDYKKATSNNIYELAGGNNKVYLLYKIKPNIVEENEEVCNNAQLLLEYKFKDPMALTGVLFLRGTVSGEGNDDDGYGTAEDGYQRFYAYSDEVEKRDLKLPIKQCEAVCKPKNNIPENCSYASRVEKGQVVVTFQEGYDSNNRLNIDKCIIDNVDINNNSYAVASYRENPYCNVYCKEDLDIRMPYKIETYSGRKIDLDVVITGTQSCYTSKIDYAKYRADLANATGVDRQNIENNYNACMNVNVGYNLNPTVKYKYEELVGSSGVMNLKKATKCTGGSTLVDGKCVTDSGAKKYGTDQMMRETKIVANYTTPRIYYVSNTNLGLIKINISDEEKPYFVRVNGLPININTPSGVYNYQIELDNIGTFYSDDKAKQGRIYGGADSLAAYREDEKKTVKNKYACTYGVNISDGQDYCINENEVLVPMDCEENETAEQCRLRFCQGQSNTPKCIKEKGEYYVCTSDHYDPTKCGKSYGSDKKARTDALTDVQCINKDGVENKRCKQNVNCCPQCEIIIVEEKECPACIITNGGITVDYRTISTSKVNPNVQNAGYNWNQNNNGPIGVKAEYTITEIEKSEEKRFEDSVNGSGVLTDNYTLRVIMTPDMAKEIRDYNKLHRESGNYTNNSLSCTDYELSYPETTCEEKGYSWIDGKCVIDNIFCYSTFIDWLIGEFGSEKVIAPHRSEAKENHATFESYSIDGIDPGKANVQTNGYWTIFPKYVSEDAGPSWK